MTDRQYSIHGKVIRKKTERGVADLRVEAWGKHLKFFKKRVSKCITDEQGQFLIEFSEAQLHKCLLQPNLALFFKIFDNEEQIYSTENTREWNCDRSDLGTSENPLIIAVDLPEIPESPTTYTVKGYVRNEEGQAQPNVTVQVYDIAIANQSLLGETTTDEAGKYKLDYQPSTDEQYIDRIVRVCDEADNKLDPVSIDHNLRLVQHNFGNKPPQPSEDEQLQTNLDTFLQDKILSKLNPTDLALLAEKTDLNAEHLTSLFLSNQLAQQTDLPAELFYGLLRQQLPTQLLPLLNLDPQVWRTALEKALENNQIPVSFRDNLDTYLEQLQQKAEEAKADNQSGTPNIPRIKLNSRLLNHSVLDNLREEADSSHDYLNQTLNATLKQVLSDSLANQGYVGLATFVKTMPDADLGQEAKTSLRDFMAAQVDRARQQSNFSNIYKSLSDAVQTLSTSTTLSQLLGLDAPLETHPLFDYTAQLTRVHSLLDTSSLLRDRSLKFDPENPEESNCDLSQTYLVPSDKDAEQDSIRGIVFSYSHRFIRLWQRLDISILDLDRCIASLQPNNINEEFIFKLASAKKLQARLDIPFAKLLSLWANIDTHGADSLYNQLFLNKAALEIDLAFEPKNGVYLSDGEEDISEHIPTLLAGFRISADDLQLIQLDSGINDNSQLSCYSFNSIAPYLCCKRSRLQKSQFKCVSA